MSVYVGLAPYKLCVQTLEVVTVERVPRTFCDEKGLEVSLGRFFQDLLVQGKICNGSLQPCVLFLKLLEPFCLIEVESPVLAPPSVIGVVGYANFSYCLTNTLAFCNGNFDLPEFGKNLFRAMSFSWHFCLPSICPLSDLSDGHV